MVKIDLQANLKWVGGLGWDGERKRCFDINKTNALWVCWYFSGHRGVGVGMSL